MSIIHHLITVLLFWSVATNASPFYPYQKRQADNTTVPMNGTGSPVNGSSGGFSNTTSSNSSSSSVEIFLTSGNMPSNGSAKALFNTTGTLNITQLYTVSEAVNKSLQSSSGGIVILADKSSFESLSFFLSIVLNTEKAVVITNDIQIGTIVAMDSNSTGRGVLYVGKSKIIFAGDLPPFGVPVGVVGDNNEAYWFYNTAQKSGMFSMNSTLRTTYSNFTNPTLNSQVAVPIVYEEGITSSLSSALGSSSAISGMVIVSDKVVSNVTSQSTTSSMPAPVFPVICVNPPGKISWLSEANIPSYAIAGGYLSPVQAQILLGVAVNNNVTSPDSIRALFP
ncbi:similar to Saccharomyces cerevisiae YHR139C SPS100 Protein required for spore wall maturation [Maudiozyma barnettii]|uniref:Similar to Saccharomyces cerevisiae YHR139C SPS100 Protein required for spore wall maturation n=1 Tax=Maudiozyma barnettii TaxID=61262 RepID=A0A8H2VHX3_9SACH|nr:Sps100p [Kazachstania barnettii]CAB4255643.1 similar to Saccharomyces cerevisiae YHR139C SPS100 Protein required for spore wall maturation [Kazachstania barnettii]CAD1784204.1 similar to Saccharomyces cerevisiae YHR139C SPS100 Protein required for spore wall maturation [Kazachstania barnettii]